MREGKFKSATGRLDAGMEMEHGTETKTRVEIDIGMNKQDRVG